MVWLITAAPSMGAWGGGAAASACGLLQRQCCFLFAESTGMDLWCHCLAQPLLLNLILLVFGLAQPLPLNLVLLVFFITNLHENMFTQFVGDKKLGGKANKLVGKFSFQNHLCGPNQAR